MEFATVREEEQRGEEKNEEESGVGRIVCR